MKAILLAICLTALAITSYAQTTLTVDANGSLNSPKIVAQTSAGQSFFTGHQLGSTYSFPSGIFRAWTDNPNGTQNYFFEGVTNTTTNYFVRADGLGYFASGMGIGTSSPKSALDVGRLLNSGDLSTVLARLSEGNNTGAGTYLGIKGYDTQISGSNTDPANVKSFAIEHSFYGITNSSINFFRGNGMTGGSIAFNTDQNVEKMRILFNGNVLIGKTTQANTAYKLDVAGSVRANQIVVNTTGADFVFAPAYQLLTLNEVKLYIDKNHHLPDIAPASEMQTKGLDVGDNQTKLLQKIEELTLYLIEKDKEVKQQQDKLNLLQAKMELLQKAVQSITK